MSANDSQLHQVCIASETITSIRIHLEGIQKDQQNQTALLINFVSEVRKRLDDLDKDVHTLEIEGGTRTGRDSILLGLGVLLGGIMGGLLPTLISLIWKI